MTYIVSATIVRVGVHSPHKKLFPVRIVRTRAMRMNTKFSSRKSFRLCSSGGSSSMNQQICICHLELCTCDTCNLDTLQWIMSATIIKNKVSVFSIGNCSWQTPGIVKKSDCEKNECVSVNTEVSLRLTFYLFIFSFIHPTKCATLTKAPGTGYLVLQ